MSNTPPFGPPPANQPPGSEQPNPGGDPTAGSSLAGLLLGFFIVLLPAGILGVTFAILSNTSLSGWIQTVVALVLAIAIPAGLFVAVSTNLKDGTPQQQQLRTAMRIIVFVGIGTYALGGIVVGGCLALLASAY